MESCVRGHHIYRVVWSPTLGEVLQCTRELEKHQGSLRCHRGRPSFRKCCKGEQKHSFIKIGGARHKSVCDSTRPLGGSGGMPPQEIFVFRLSEIESGAFSGTTLTDKLYCGMGVLEACDVKHNSI